jgi:hypothetical protein
MVKELTEKITRLEKNSTNSSNSPSPDIACPPKKDGRKGQKRTPDAQKGIKSTKGRRFLRNKPAPLSFMNYPNARVARAG